MKCTTQRKQRKRHKVSYYKKQWKKGGETFLGGVTVGVSAPNL